MLLCQHLQLHCCYYRCNERDVPDIMLRLIATKKIASAIEGCNVTGSVQGQDIGSLARSEFAKMAGHPIKRLQGLSRFVDNFSQRLSRLADSRGSQQRLMT